MDRSLSQIPTVRSELARGAKAAVGCFNKNGSRIERVKACLYEISSDSQQRTVEFQPFIGGLFLTAWMFYGTEIPLCKQLVQMHVFSDAILKKAQDDRGTIYLLWRNAQSRLKLSDYELLMGALPDATLQSRTETLQEMSVWKRSSPINPENDAILKID